MSRAQMLKEIRRLRSIEVSMPEERGGVSLVELEAEFRGVAPAPIAKLSRWAVLTRAVRRLLRL